MKNIILIIFSNMFVSLKWETCELQERDAGAFRTMMGTVTDSVYVLPVGSMILVYAKCIDVNLILYKCASISKPLLNVYV